MPTPCSAAFKRNHALVKAFTRWEGRVIFQEVWDISGGARRTVLSEWISHLSKYIRPSTQAFKDRTIDRLPDAEHEPFAGTDNRAVTGDQFLSRLICSIHAQRQRKQPRDNSLTTVERPR